MSATLLPFPLAGGRATTDGYAGACGHSWRPPRRRIVPEGQNRPRHPPVPEAGPMTAPLCVEQSLPTHSRPSRLPEPTTGPTSEQVFADLSRKPEFAGSGRSRMNGGDGERAVAKQPLFQEPDQASVTPTCRSAPRDQGAAPRDLQACRFTQLPSQHQGLGWTAESPRP